jgi:hypothetical protein
MNGIPAKMLAVGWPSGHYGGRLRATAGYDYRLRAAAARGCGLRGALPDLVLVLAPIRFCCLPVTRI